MTDTRDLALTALAPAIWGSSYIVTTTFLPGESPYLVALLRALPAGLLLLLLVRQLPPVALLPKIFVLGALNLLILLFCDTFSRICIFWARYATWGGRCCERRPPLM